MYKRGGKLRQAISLILEGSTQRDVQRLTGMHSVTTKKILDALKNAGHKINCRCGDPLGHKGWCSYRYNKSKKRQQTMQRLNPEWHVLIAFENILSGCEIIYYANYLKSLPIEPEGQDEEDRYLYVLGVKGIKPFRKIVNCFYNAQHIMLSKTSQKSNEDETLWTWEPKNPNTFTDNDSEKTINF